jgi:hypothetical protein
MVMYSLFKNEYRTFKLVETTIRKGLKLGRKIEDINKVRL